MLLTRLAYEIPNSNEFAEKLRHSLLEVYRHGSRNGNPFELRDPGKDNIRGYRLEYKKSQEHEQPHDSSHKDRWAYIHHKFMKGVVSHGECSN